MGGFMMDLQTLLNLFFTGAGAVCGWILRVVWQEIKLVQANQQDLERELTDNYVRKDDYRIDIAEIKGMFNRIMDKLDTKMDK
jgi:hypothetical protein